jgi:uncharacterized protein
MVQILIPKEIIAKWVGAESGLRGIMIGTVVGSFTPGGPYVSLPMMVVLLRSGSGIGTVVAFLTAWSLLAIAQLPMEIGILGVKFALVRRAVSFFFPPIAGILAQLLFGKVKFW